jgi:hypothetical protein
LLRLATEVVKPKISFNMESNAKQMVVLTVNHYKSQAQNDKYTLPFGIDPKWIMMT